MGFHRPALGMLVVGALLVAGCRDSGGSSDADVEAAPTDSAHLPTSVEAIELQSIDDGSGDPSQSTELGDLLDDRLMVLNFFASWCAPCIEEMPDFEVVHQDMETQVAFVGIAFQDGDARARQIIETTGVTYPTYADPNGDALTFFQGTNMPTTVLLAPDGEILDVHSRPLTERQLRDRIDQFGSTG